MFFVVLSLLKIIRFFKPKFISAIINKVKMFAPSTVKIYFISYKRLSVVINWSEDLFLKQINGRYEKSK